MFSILQKLFPPIWWHCLLIHFQYFICYVIYFLDTWNQSKQKQIWFLHFIFCGSGHKLMSDFSIFWSSKIQRFSVISDDWTFVQTLTKGKAFLTNVQYLCWTLEMCCMTNNFRVVCWLEWGKKKFQVNWVQSIIQTTFWPKGLLLKSILNVGAHPSLSHFQSILLTRSQKHYWGAWPRTW